MLKPAKSRIQHQPPPKPGCVLAFGKHPGWEDHAEDVGESSPALAKLKQHLYNNAIASVIDQGRWQAAASQGASGEASSKASWPYGHEFLAWLDGAFIAGIIMPSRDARQRDRYPLILAAHLEPFPSSARLSQVFRELRQVHTSAGSSDQQTLRRAVAVATASLSQPQSQSPPQSQSQPSDEAAWSARSALAWAEPSRWPAPAAQPDATPASSAAPSATPTGLLRTLYELTRELGAPSAGEVAQHLRSHIAAGTSASAAAELPLWLAAVWATHGSPLPVMAIKPIEHAVVDVIIGHCDAATIWPIRQDVSSVPPASEVPYVIDPADQARLTSLVTRWSTPQGSEGKEAIAARNLNAAPAAAASSASTANRIPSASRGKSIPTGLIVAGVVVVLLVLALLAWLATR